MDRWANLGLILSCLVINQNAETIDLYGPRFVREPLSVIDFSNSTGISIDCLAKGNPTPVIEWIRPDGAVVGNVQGLRYVLSNGTIYFPPFRAEEYRQDVHASIYACAASNPFGRIISREVTLRAVVQQYYEAQVYDEFVIRGSTAVFRCQIPSFVLDYVIVTSWTRENSNGIQTVIEGGGRFTVFPNGILHIRDVNAGDGGRHYRCRTQHRLTGEIRLSNTAGRLLITEPQSSVPPRITHSMGMVEAYQGDAVELPCAAQGSPTPAYTWMKVKDSLFYPVHLGERISKLGGNVLVRSVQMVDMGTYVCIVNNSVGVEKIETALFVTAALSVRIQPNSQTIDVGKIAQMTCVVTGYPVTSITWVKNGRVIVFNERFKVKSKETFEIDVFQREDRGMYQCVARNNQMTAQGTSEIKLGDAIPLLEETFPSQLVAPGRDVLLKCVISGNPSPQISWTLDDDSIPKKNNLVLADHVSIHGEVTSVVNITSIKPEDGGEYRCSGKNIVGKTEHSARLNISGPPYIRPLSNVSVVAGRTAHIRCRVSGHPVESVFWKRGGSVLPINHRQKVYSNGSLFILNAQESMDAGLYTCFAQSPSGQLAQRKMHVYVLNAPMISPFSFADNLKEGMRAGVTCLITQGDFPIKIEWLKDNKPIGSHLAISIRNIDEYTSNLVITSIAPRHNGNYTCIATNAAASVQYTARLLVKVPPQWLIEPKDSHVILHRSTHIDCQAIGFPEPIIKWKKASGNVPVDYQEIPSEGLTRYTAQNGSLIIHRADETDEGHFLCQANNGIGPELSKVIYLDVRIPAHFDMKHSNVTVKNGDKGRLVCTAYGDPEITITWKTNDKIADSKLDPRIRIKTTLLNNGLQSELIISKVKQKDFTSFNCHASNAFGSDETQIYLIIQDRPNAPTHLSTSRISSRSLFLAWEPSFDGNSPIIRYVVQHKLNEASWFKSTVNTSVLSEKTSIRVTRLLPAKRYDIRVRAENSVGMSNASSVIGITTEEEAPGGPPLSIELEAVSSQSLRVKWKPPKSDVWFGDLTGYNIGYREVDSEEDYIVKSTDHRPDENVYLISNLKKSFSYGVVISAFNGKGSGPQSAEVVASTLEDVPSQSPHNVKCSTLSSNVILVSWKAPKPETIHGVLQGYKLYYESDSNFKEKSSVTTKSTQMELTKLRSFSNYTVSVAAYTRAGDGMFSETIQCQTLESVPGPPAEIKALVMSSDAILVSWLPPRNPNGIITKYSIYMKRNGQQETDAVTHSLPANQLYYEARGLQENNNYEFWVTTATSVGDGAQSPLVSKSPTSIVPAKIASFSEKHVVPQNTEVKLSCRSVGIPTPDREWKLRDKKITQESRFQFASDGSLNMANVRSSDSGNYTCSIHNIYATDELTHEVIVQIDKERTGPPTPPVVKFTPLSTSSILASWYVDDDGSTAIEGYTLNYKRAGEDWQDLHFGFNITNYTLPDLQCGTRYQLYMSAYNRLGQSRPSEVTLISTLGKAPIVPPKDSFISVNSTFVSLNLRAWQSVDPEVCKVKHLSVDYRAFNQKEWTLLMQSVKVEQNSFAVGDLSSGVTYVLRITAHSDTGLTIADFDVMLSQEHDALPDSSLQNYNKHYRFYLDINVIISTVVLFAVVVFLLTIGCYLVNRKRYTGYKQGNPPKHHYVQNESQKQSQFQKTPCNDHQQYSPTTHKELGTTEAALFSSSGATQDDICPYATYQLPGCLMEDSIELRTFNPPSVGSELLQSANVLPINVVYSKVKKHPKSIKVDYDEMQRKETDYEKELLYCKEKPCLTQLYCDVLPHKIYSKSVIATGPSPNHYDGLSLKRYAEKQSCNLQVLEPTYNTRQFNTVPDLLYHQQDSTSSNESSPPESESGLSSQNNST